MHAVFVYELCGCSVASLLPPLVVACTVLYYVFVYELCGSSVASLLPRLVVACTVLCLCMSCVGVV